MLTTKSRAELEDLIERYAVGDIEPLTVAETELQPEPIQSDCVLV